MREISFELFFLLVIQQVGFVNGNNQPFMSLNNFAGYALILFFPIFVFFMSMVQGHLEKRKDARLAAAKARAKNPEWQRGW